MDENVQQYINTFEEILADMENGMDNAELSNSISATFINQMIPHHEAAIKMSENILKYSDDAAVRSIAEGIITEQTKSICARYTRDAGKKPIRMRILRNIFPHTSL